MGCAASSSRVAYESGTGDAPGDRPSHWAAPTAKERSHGCGLVPVEKQADSAVWEQLQGFLAVDDPKSLGYGRDLQQKSKQKYVALRLAAAWRIQNPALWARYSAGKQKIRNDLRAVSQAGKGHPKRGGPGLPLRLHAQARTLPGPPLDDEIRETMLMHGTKPQFLLNILANGPNERYSGAIGTLFGNGMYFAEDADKVDQYVAVDKAFVKQQGPTKGALHARLYGTVREQKHPGSVYYLLICRVALGHYVRTRDAAPACKSMDAGGSRDGAVPCFARGDNPRELATVPGVNPPVHFHSLLGEKGPGHLRHREIVLFHGEYLYPEYLLAVHRVGSKGQPV